MTGVQKAYEIDDWCQVLIDIPFAHVENAMLEYMGTCDNLTEHGTLRRIAPAAIREKAWQLKQVEELRNAPRLPPPVRSYDEPYTDVVPREQMLAWWQAWRECGLAAKGEELDAYKLRIRTRANEINPDCGWRIPGEPLR